MTRLLSTDLLNQTLADLDRIGCLNSLDLRIGTCTSTLDGRPVLRALRHPAGHWIVRHLHHPMLSWLDALDTADRTT